ncbi:MAG: tetratricopeptide repeat protein [Elusimicrobia bacterium]|nr:tetratricopeptide repeat protein [Candidatus Obscuribacterium magneticum]
MGALLLSFSFTAAHQLGLGPEAGDRTQLELVESGRATPNNCLTALYHLSAGDYQKAFDSLTPEGEREFPWLRSYLEGLHSVSSTLIKSESEHFIFCTPHDQEFLKEYALPALEDTATYMEKAWGYRPEGHVRVEIYSNKDDFSKASTLSPETLERSGAIGICKFHRLMILSPRSLPLGYRWLDSLSHEYVHLLINELSGCRMELWLHEGTARYFDTAYRKNPPEFLTPDQKTKLKEALEKDTLISFARMSPSMVVLKDQNEVTLAFAEVSHAVSILVKDSGTNKYAGFLRSLSELPFNDAFKKSFSLTPEDFEKKWRGDLEREKWEKTKGTLSDAVVFKSFSEDDVIGADVQGRVHLGDEMRKRRQFGAALMEYEKALQEEPDNAVVLLKAAKTHLASNDREKAVQKLRRATDKNPNYVTPHIELALLVEPKEALPHLLEANAINPFDPRIHGMLSEIYAKRGEGEKSKRESEIYDLLRR